MLLPLKHMDKLPKSYFNEHLWADYIELLCLIQVDRVISKSDVLDRVRIVAEDLQEGQDDNEAEDTLPGDNLDELPAAELNDKWAGRASTWFRHLSYRAGAFGSSYPFSLTETEDVLKVSSSLTAEQKLYVFLLLCSNLRYCESSMGALTKTFERLSAEVIKQCLPATAEVHIFGTSEITGGRYTGDLWTNINKLARDLGESVKIARTDLAPSDYGDGGLDIVAWVPLGDVNTHRIVLLGQCACTLNWELKQYTATALKWSQAITLSPSVISVIFIPHALRRADGSWHDKINMTTTMIDRPRFMHLIGNKLDNFNESPGHAVAEDAIAQREDIY